METLLLCRVLTMKLQFSLTFPSSGSGLGKAAGLARIHPTLPAARPRLSALTHQEDPWLDARRSLHPGERGNQEITLAAMAEYYGGLYGQHEAG